MGSCSIRALILSVCVCLSICLFVFRLSACLFAGWFGLHRMYRIMHYNPTDTMTLALAIIACVILGPVFFAQDGFCFADFLREDDIVLLGPDVETLSRLEKKLQAPRVDTGTGRGRAKMQAESSDGGCSIRIDGIGVGDDRAAV